jgi:ACS family hexuronate transporter-like MFS transporter
LRAKAVAILLCGLSVGALVTPPFVALVTQLWGWRASFALAGGLGFVLLPAWSAAHRWAGTSPGAVTDRAGESDKGPPLLEVLTSRRYLCLLCGRSVTDAVWVFYLFWMPGYFQEVRHFSLAAVGGLLWIPFFFADAGSLAGGWISSGLLARGWSHDKARRVVLGAAAVLGISGAFAPFIASATLAMAAISVTLFAQLAWASVQHTTISEVSPTRHVAVLYGITGAAGNGLGALTQPFVGRVVDSAGYDPVFLATGVAYAIAFFSVILAGKIEPVRRQ